MRTYILTLLCVLILAFAQGQEISGEELLERAISFHDPAAKWSNAKLQLIVDMDTPNSPMRRSEITIDNSKGSFHLRQLQRGNMLEWMVDGNDSTDFRVNFIQPSDSIQMDSLSLTPDRAKRWRNYYTYLYGLPMKLRDPGTKIDPNVQRTRFLNQEVLALKVTYNVTVGKDIWYFYFNPETYAMIGYRFYHDEAANDGEYIVLEGLEIKNGLRIPKNRTWYTNAEDKLLGTDFLVELKIEN